MILEKGDMWSIFEETDAFIITTNPVIKKDGSIVMGRGIAKQAKDRFPRLPYDFAKALKEAKDIQGYEDAQYPTYCGAIGEFADTGVWWFMVKDHWAEKAKTSIIEISTRELKSLAEYFSDRRFDLNFPGIGNGGLDREEVLPIIEVLPDNVHVWEFDSGRD